MKRKMAIFMVVLPVLLGAGAWTENSVAKGHPGVLAHTPVAFVASQASALFVKAVDLASQITEQQIFLALGACFVSLALALHRRSAKQRGD